MAHGYASLLPKKGLQLVSVHYANISALLNRSLDLGQHMTNSNLVKAESNHGDFNKLNTMTCPIHPGPYISVETVSISHNRADFGIKLSYFDSL